LYDASADRSKGAWRSLSLNQKQEQLLQHLQIKSEVLQLYSTNYVVDDVKCT
jgi:hypothetical protein